MLLELAEADGAVCVHEVRAGGNDTLKYSTETVRLSLDDAKRTLAASQRHPVHSQVADHCSQRRGCLRCGAQRPLKDRRARRLTSLFGVVEVLCTAVQALSLRRGVSPEHHPGSGDYA